MRCANGNVYYLQHQFTCEIYCCRRRRVYVFVLFVEFAPSLLWCALEFVCLPLIVSLHWQLFVPTTYRVYLLFNSSRCLFCHSQSIRVLFFGSAFVIHLIVCPVMQIVTCRSDVDKYFDNIDIFVTREILYVMMLYRCNKQIIIIINV